MTSPHPDAFRLITYLSADASVRELVWNTTESAAPSTIQVRGGVARRVPGHEPLLMRHCPSVGDVVLIESTWEWAVPEALAEAERRFPDGGAAYQECLAELFHHHLVNITQHYPRAEVVTEAMCIERGWTSLLAG